MKDDMQFMQLWDLYSPMLTATQQEITNLYFNCDLSLGEIAEEKGVSRQSVSDCLQKCRKQLEKFESKLGFCKMLNELSDEYSAYMTTVERWMASQEKTAANQAPIRQLREKLKQTQQSFGVEYVQTEGGVIVGKTAMRGDATASEIKG